MNINSVKNNLESAYFIGFNIKGTNDDFVITLKGSSQDKFKMKCEVKDGIRLKISVEPEKYGANFLRLINYSNRIKREGFVSLLHNINVGETKILINNIACSSDVFINDETVWNSFEIKYMLIPYEDSAVGMNAIKSLCGMMLSLIDYSVEGYKEGAKKESVSVKYERNPVNRAICLAYYGYSCQICGFSFEDKYGEIGKNVIEVHHKKMVSEMDEDYIVKPIEDLVPVCSNCHTMLHRKDPPFMPEELKELIHLKKKH